MIESNDVITHLETYGKDFRQNRLKKTKFFSNDTLFHLTDTQREG